MNQEQFEKSYSGDWKAFEELLDAFTRRKKTIGLDQAENFPRHYRRLCKQLALARDRCYSTRVVDHLNQLVLRAHQLMYKPKAGAAHLFKQFFLVNFPRAVRAEARLFWFCSLLFYGPVFGMLLAIQWRPELVYSVMDPVQVAHFEEMYDPESWQERAALTDVGMLGHYITNNTHVSFMTYAGGLLAGVGSFFYLILNGLLIGSVMGHILQTNGAEQFLSFVVGHSSLELTGIVLAGVAGVRLGRALVFPGEVSRRMALIQAGGKSITLVFGMAVMILMAAFVEAFWSPRLLPAQIKYAVGLTGWAVVAIYFFTAGRRHEN